MKHVLALLIAVFATQVSFAGPFGGKNVQTTAGMVSPGTSMEGSNILVFKGIPFAAPPVGKLRWRAPEAPKAWTGVRSGNEFSKACIQAPTSFEVLNVGDTDEDCLYLNVWTPATTGKLPVIVWIHGGGLTTGSGAIYPGEYLARKGAVVVSFNYRLNVFGFLTHSDLPAETASGTYGNYGHLDQIAALKWVHDNIEHFGGNPDNVTIAGQSSGASSVAMMMSTPMASGLFQKAILLSGAPGGLDTNLEEANKNGATLAERVQCDSVDCMRDIPAADLFKAAQGSKALPGLSFGPIQDGTYWTASPSTQFEAMAQAKVPVMVGTTHDEAAMFLRENPITNTFFYRLALSQYFGDYADEVYAKFKPKNNADVQPTMVRLLTASGFTSPAEVLLRQMSKAGMPAYQYQFNRLAPNTAAYKMSVFHGIDMFYPFGWLYNTEGFEQTDLDIADAMQTYWVNFATTADPNKSSISSQRGSGGLPMWPAFTEANDERYLEIGDTLTVKPNLCTQTAAACDLFQSMK